MAVDRRADDQRGHLTLQLADHCALSLERQRLGPQIEPEPLLLERAVLLGVGERDLGLRQRVLAAQDVDLRDRAICETLLVALELARRGLAIDLGLIDHLLRAGARLLGIEPAARDLRLESGKGRALL